MKKIDSSESNFTTLIKNNLLYVDKTEYLYNLITNGSKYSFLSRPRRFGKSLTLQTLEAIFKGEKDLFKDLYIGKTDYDFKEYPVLLFDFSKVPQGTAKDLKVGLKYTLSIMANSYGLELESELFETQLDELVRKLNISFGQVVILVDEYDSPLTKHIFDDDLEEIRSILKAFYSSLKANSKYLKFVFITGVSKYAKVGIFSGMNNLVNISLDSDYATMLGFTEKEIKENFSEYIDKGVKQLGITKEEYLLRLKEQYDGNCFSLDEKVDTVYNPVSVGLFFTSGKCKNFNNYWMETGSTELIMKMARENDFSILTDSKKTINYDSVGENDIATLINNPSEESLLFLMYQTGYLTLKEKDENGRYVLDYPNNEVKTSFSSKIVNKFIQTHSLSSTSAENIMSYLRRGEVKEAFDKLNTIYASLSYKCFNKNSNEKSYMLPLISVINASINVQTGERAHDEESVSSGDIDYVIELKDYIYILEAKLNKSSKEALNSIIDRGYYKKYISENRKLILIGINFNYSKEQKIKRLMDEPEYSVIG